MISSELKINNKGTGAGGANTTLNGSLFEERTSIENKLLENKFIKKEIDTKTKNKKGYYFEYIDNDYKIIYLTQSGFVSYFTKEFNIDSKYLYRRPDEAFLILHNNQYYLKILEKKNQNCDGSVEDKLKTGLFNKKEYDEMLRPLCDNYKFNVSYAFCVSKFLQNKFESNQFKYNNILKIMNDDNIKLFYGEDENYLDVLFNWINQIN